MLSLDSLLYSNLSLLKLRRTFVNLVPGAEPAYALQISSYCQHSNYTQLPFIEVFLIITRSARRMLGRTGKGQPAKTKSQVTVGHAKPLWALSNPTVESNPTEVQLLSKVGPREICKTIPLIPRRSLLFTCMRTWRARSWNISQQTDTSGSVKHAKTVSTKSDGLPTTPIGTITTSDQFRIDQKTKAL